MFISFVHNFFFFLPGNFYLFPPLTKVFVQTQKTIQSGLYTKWIFVVNTAQSRLGFLFLGATVSRLWPRFAPGHFHILFLLSFMPQTSLSPHPPQLPFESFLESCHDGFPTPPLYVRFSSVVLSVLLMCLASKKKKKQKKTLYWWGLQSRASSQYAEHKRVFLRGISYWRIQLN